MTKMRSCMASAEQLRAWGFKVAGSVTTHDEWVKGDDIHIARRKAREAGLLVESHWEDHERTWVGSTKCGDFDVELVSWFCDSGRLDRLEG